LLLLLWEKGKGFCSENKTQRDFNAFLVCFFGKGDNLNTHWGGAV